MITSVELVIYSVSHTKPTSHRHTEQTVFCQRRNTSVLVIIKLLDYIYNNHFKSSSPSFQVVFPLISCVTHEGHYNLKALDNFSQISP
jgi:hypothetical protein